MNNEIIDFERKGNVIRFYLGKNGKQWGDDWNDIPYEHNAERVYDEFIEGYCDIAIDFSYEVEEPADDYLNSIYSKEMMRDKKVYAVKFLTCFGRDDILTQAYHVCFGDRIEDVLKLKYIKLIKKGGKKCLV